MAESILITAMPDGMFNVKAMEDEPGEGGPQMDQTVASVDEVLELVKQGLSASGETSEQEPAAAPKAPAAEPTEDQMWNQEAAKRPPSGLM